MEQLVAELKEWGIKRQLPVGKKMGSNIWVHKEYLAEILEPFISEPYLNAAPADFEYNIVRYDCKAKSLCLMLSRDFDVAHEPTITASVLIKKSGDSYYCGKIRHSQTVWHHKWLFVKPSYHGGWSIKDSMRRSLEWKRVLGNNRSLSSRIGRRKYWDLWLASNSLTPRLPTESAA